MSGPRFDFMKVSVHGVVLCVIEEDARAQVFRYGREALEPARQTSGQEGVRQRSSEEAAAARARVELDERTLQPRSEREELAHRAIGGVVPTDAELAPLAEPLRARVETRLKAQRAFREDRDQRRLSEHPSQRVDLTAGLPLRASMVEYARSRGHGVLAAAASRLFWLAAKPVVESERACSALRVLTYRDATSGRQLQVKLTSQKSPIGSSFFSPSRAQARNRPEEARGIRGRRGGVGGADHEPSRRVPSGREGQSRAGRRAEDEVEQPRVWAAKRRGEEIQPARAVSPSEAAGPEAA